MAIQDGSACVAMAMPYPYREFMPRRVTVMQLAAVQPGEKNPEIKEGEQRGEQVNKPGWIRAAGTTAVPTLFSATFMLEVPRCDIEMDFMTVSKRTDDPGVLKELRIKRLIWPSLEHGEPLATALLRSLSIEELTRRAYAAAAQPIVEVEAEPGLFQLVRDVEAGSDQMWGSPRLREAGRGKTTKTATLERVAEIYRGALATGNPPTQAVAENLPCSRSYAGYLVRQARAEGYLGATSPGRAAE